MFIFIHSKMLQSYFQYFHNSFNSIKLVTDNFFNTGSIHVSIADVRIKELTLQQSVTDWTPYKYFIPRTVLTNGPPESAKHGKPP